MGRRAARSGALRTTNVVDSPFAALRLRTGAAKRFRKAMNATCLGWKALAEMVYRGATFKDGKMLMNKDERRVAA